MSSKLKNVKYGHLPIMVGIIKYCVNKFTKIKHKNKPLKSLALDKILKTTGICVKNKTPRTYRQIKFFKLSYFEKIDYIFSIFFELFFT